jgi:hypothetical protein
MCDDCHSAFPYCLKEADKASVNIPSPPPWVKKLSDFGKTKVDRVFAAAVRGIWGIDGGQAK